MNTATTPEVETTPKSRTGITGFDQMTGGVPRGRRHVGTLQATDDVAAALG